MVRQITKLKLFFTCLLLLTVLLAAAYLKTQSSTLYGGDAGDFLSAIAVRGIAHPPGYPLYTSLGILINQLISRGTLAYKVSYLSLVPSILSVIFLYLFLTKLTRYYIIPLFSVLVIALTYPFWLLSVVVEVFALNNLFLVLILLSFYLYYKNGRHKLLYLGFFLTGLSLTHHHLSILMLPAIIYLLKRRLLKIPFKQIALSVIFFFSGFSYYLYVFFSVKTNPAVNWMGSLSLTDFINLFFRTLYGTLTAGKFVNANIPLRLLSFLALADFIIQDLKVANLLIIFAGIYFLYKYKKRIFKLFLLTVLPFVFFLFYAGFPLKENFMLGTFERFILPVYLFLTIPYSFGLLLLLRFFAKIRSMNFRWLLQLLFLTLFLIFQLRSIVLPNFYRISSLKNDFTAENLASDIFAGVESNAIIILSTDTALFNSQYLYYTRGKWPDVKLIHFSKLYLPFYAKTLRKAYPQLKGIKLIKSASDFEDFLEANADEFPIYAKVNFQLQRGYFLPYGLLYKYFSNSEKILPEIIVGDNERIFSSLHDPLRGSLGQYRHLLLSDILRVYAQAYLEIAYYEARNNFGADAKKYLEKTKEIDPLESDAYLLMAQILIKEGLCREANDEITALEKLKTDGIKSDYLKYLNYSLCYKDEEKALIYKKSYDEKIR